MTNSVNEFHAEGLTFQGPGIYRISLLGALDPRWSDWLGDMSITTTQRADQRAVTTLVGQFRDQAALLGVLNALYDLHLPLFQVEYLGRSTDDQKNAET